MPWTAPKTWTTNEILTSPDMNTYVRDNTRWLGTDRPRCWVSRGGTQSIPNTTATAITFVNADTFDVGDMHDPGVNPSRITAPTGGGGLYAVSCFVHWAANSTGRRVMHIRKGGSTLVWYGQYAAPGLVELWVTAVNGYVQLAAGEYFEITVSQESGGSLLVNAATCVAEWIAT